MLLQDPFANKNDPDYKQNAENTFKSIKIKETETTFSYNKRFGYLYRNFTGCGLTMSEMERAHIYLQGLQHHQDTRILFEVKDHTKTLDTKEFKGLTEIQRLLLCEEELANPNSYRQPPRIKRDKRGQPITHAHSASSKTGNAGKPKYKNKASIKCHGCHKFGHFLSEC